MTTETKHTPGPWTLLARNRVNRQREPMFDVVSGKAENTEIVCDKAREVDARLIAAAPDLLAACRCALADLEGIMPEFEPSGDRQHPGWTTIEELKAVIARATGTP